MNSFECQEDARFAEILELEGYSIQDYYQMGGEMFPDAITYPNFFNENLVSPNRVLKVFKDNVQSNIKIFYIQILRLAYEISLEDNNSKMFMLNLRRIVFHPEFEILFTQETEEKRDLYNDFQFKKLFAEFLVILDRQQSPNILQILSQYPIMDTIFIHILRSLLASQNINEQFDVKIPTEIVFGQLSSLTQLTVTSYGNCWKFQDSDMFCYEQNDNELYLAYIVDDGIEQNTENYQQNSEQYPSSSNNQQTYNNYQPPRPQPVNQYQSNTTQMQKSMTSQRPTASMISQNYQFTDYLGATTIQKHRVPRNQKQKQDGLANNFTGYLNKAQNNIKSSFSYQNPINDYKQPEYNSNDYFSNTYDNKKSNDYKESNYGSSYQSYDTKPSEYKPYESSYSYNDTYSSSYKPEPYKPVEYIPSNVYKPEITGKSDYFKPVEPTPLPNFDSYKSTYVQPKRETNYGNYGNDNYKLSSSAAYESNYKTTTNNSYKPTYQTSGMGDYYNDFTPPDILSKLRPQIRDNINKIRESMRGVVKGAQLPPDFDIRKSAVFSNNSAPKQQLFRNQSRSQFEYVETHKTNSSKPFTADLSQYTSNRFSSNFAY